MSTTCRDLLSEAAGAGLVVSRDGDALLVRAFGRPTREVLSADLRRRLSEHKAELLTYLQRRERAVDMVCAVFGRVADACPLGCPVSGPRWQAAENGIDGAYETACQRGDFEPLAAALADYESRALSFFAAHQATRRGEVE